MCVIQPVPLGLLANIPSFCLGIQEETVIADHDRLAETQVTQLSESSTNQLQCFGNEAEGVFRVTL